MRNIVAAIGLAVVLAGCQTTTPEARLAEQRASCQSYGFAVGSEAYASCMMQLDLAAKADDRQRRIAASQAISNSMQRNRPVTCNTRYTPSGILGRPPVGSTTNCY